ncbi:Protein CBG26394 [Caenorhabditis briggsae]|uniref:Uncharacterized protein n=2 Tax=Caenorhabditis briggsae TaxID=6238 RepID=A0AAE9EY26_CAEBR|nr:Protein CBG26394 [Caenorhabditis briggsae]ULT95948.1 hypothetical protein L3Y34_004541 [Caenorhabditis briggsae]UMM29151.1 hypothetical protein L5515_011660 [Caenorhabditis briggsae]CAR98633.1 Protein CBG26394 [Caenorhabditis briggsae]
MAAEDIARSRKDLEVLLKQICDTKNIKQGNNDNGEYAEQMDNRMALFKKVINFALNMQESDQSYAIRVFTFDFLETMVPRLENARYSDQDFCEELNDVELKLRQLISTWKPEALEADIIQEMR